MRVTQKSLLDNATSFCMDFRHRAADPEDIYLSPFFEKTSKAWGEFLALEKKFPEHLWDVAEKGIISVGNWRLCLLDESEEGISVCASYSISGVISVFNKNDVFNMSEDAFRSFCFKLVDGLDAKAILDAMKLLDWRWADCGGVPSSEDIILASAFDLLHRRLKETVRVNPKVENVGISTKGFFIKELNIQGTNYLSIEFSLVQGTITPFELWVD